MKIIIKDLINFEIKSGSHDIEDFRSSLDEMKLKYVSFLDSYKCSDLDGLRDALIKNNSLNEDIKQTKHILKKKISNRVKELIKRNKVKVKEKYKITGI